MDYAMAAVGLVILIIGGDVLVRGSVSIALRLKVSPLIIGLTVVALGTSAPELVVSLDAAVIQHLPEMALGNVVGSNIANVLLVLGIPAILYPMTCSASSLERDTIVMVLSTLLFILLCLTGVLTFWSGVGLTTVLAGYMFYVLRFARYDPHLIEEELAELDAEKLAGLSLLSSVALIAGGLLGLCIGAHLLVVYAIDVARSLGVSEATIGLTMVALGTSLPELATSLAAAIRKHCDIAIGNVIGSNMFNLLGIMGVTSMVTPIPVGQDFLTLNLWIMLGATLLMVPFGVMRAPIGRITGIVFVSSYIAYIFLVF